MALKREADTDLRFHGKTAGIKNINYINNAMMLRLQNLGNTNLDLVPLSEKVSSSYYKEACECSWVSPL